MSEPDNDRCTLTRRGTLSGGALGLRGALVVAEVGLSVVLLVGSLLLARSMASLHAIDPGFDGRNVLTARLYIAIGTPAAFAPRVFWRGLSTALSRAIWPRT